jgi:transcriptional regulator with XRE-family HTH domain
MDPAGTKVMNAAPRDGQDVGPTNHEESGSGTSEERRRELADFLRTRREKIKPEQVGITQLTRRRTPGLRREEVAELAGVGTTWYTWLEQARDIQPSSEVLRRLGQALQLNSAEVRHMFALAGKAPPAEVDGRDEKATESMLRLLNDAIQVPAVLLGARWDVLAINGRGHKIFEAVQTLPPEKRNWLYYCLCANQPRAHLRNNWEANSRRLIAEFRSSLGDSFDSPWVRELIDMLKRDSADFERWWREHDVRDDASTILEAIDEEGNPIRFERLALRPLHNSRFRILLFTPLT